MSEDQREETLITLEQQFGNRVKRGPIRGEEPGTEDVLASVLPMNAEEVELLALVAGRHSVPLVALGGGTAPESCAEKHGIAVRFDLMRRTRVPGGEEPWVEAEPGVPWLHLDDELRVRGRGLAVYPTSAPRATVGGRLATDGLGVGSFEYGWLSENVISASVVLQGGEHREVPGEELGSFLAPGEASGIVVGARLETRRADADVPFAAAFADPADLTMAVEGVAGSSVPLWHLAFLNPAMSRARALGEDYLLFGAYPREREEKVAGPLREAVEAGRGRVFDAAETYRAWGQRFFPATPSGIQSALANVRSERTTVSGIREILADTGSAANAAVQGTVARSGEVLLLTLEGGERDSPQSGT
jgi:FAD/FMN-containing dehydrogenase